MQKRAREAQQRPCAAGCNSCWPRPRFRPTPARGLPQWRGRTATPQCRIPVTPHPAAALHRCRGQARKVSQPRRMSVRRAYVLGLFGLGRLCPKEGEAQAQVRKLCIISASNTCYGKSVLLSGHAVVRTGWGGPPCVSKCRRRTCQRVPTQPGLCCDARPPQIGQRQRACRRRATFCGSR